MSLIHEALKKAEQQRQLGSVPTLGSPVLSTRRRRAWLGPLLSLLGAAILLGGAWWWMHQRPLPPAAANPATTAPALPAPATKPAADGQPVATPTPVPQHVARSPVEAEAPPASAWIPAPIHPGKEGAAGPRPSQRTAPQPKAAVPAATAPPARTTPPAPAAAGQPAVASPPAKLAPLPAVRPKANVTANSALPLYWELPYAERKDMPEFKISMHVYADKPADRFVILNGVRQKEGDDLPGGMKLDAIDADGIVVELTGKRFRVPRDGGY